MLYQAERTCPTKTPTLCHACRGATGERIPRNPDSVWFPVAPGQGAFLSLFQQSLVKLVSEKRSGDGIFKSLFFHCRADE
jgi:hypothetical protein